MELSQDRTRSVLIYVLENTLNNSQNSSWVQSLLTANGLSYSKPIADNETEIGRKLNRRVEFKIRTNAEKQIDKMLKVSVDEED
jgi:outer membrane protein OmpA-like peptidoglycan-associated protein